MARSDFRSGEKLSLQWRGPKRVVKAINDYVYQVEDLRDGTLEEAHISRLNFYHDPSLDTEAIMSHVITSETGMVVQGLLKLVDTDDGLKVQVRWRGLPDSEDTLEPLLQIYEDVPDLLMKLLRRKNAPWDLVERAQRELHL